MEAYGRQSRLTLSARHLIVKYDLQKLSSPKIQKILEKRHCIKVSRRAVWKFLKRYKESGSVHNKPRNVSSKRKVQNIHREMIDFWLKNDCELTSSAICNKLDETFSLKVSKDCVNTIRRSLGWTTQKTKYCQLISRINRQKRIEYALESLRQKETFHNVIFVDETSVEMTSDGRLFFYKPELGIQPLQPRRQKPKHAYKVHVWAGISYRGRTDICIFTGIMDSVIYQKILTNNFLPFVNSKFPDGYRLYQDNDSKHCSKSTKQWMTECNMLENVMTTPASSPDLNPIENVWSAMKQYLGAIVKPKKRDELVDGIVQFWKSLTAEKCGKYIDHVHKVLQHVVLNEGAPTMY